MLSHEYKLCDKREEVDSRCPKTEVFWKLTTWNFWKPNGTLMEAKESESRQKGARSTPC